MIRPRAHAGSAGWKCERPAKVSPFAPAAATTHHPETRQEEVEVRSLILPCLILSVAGSGCATKKYVSREVGEVNQKVDNLNSEMEKTQERVKTSEVRLESVDRQSQ